MPLFDFTCGKHHFEHFVHSASTESIPCKFCKRTAKKDTVGSMCRGERSRTTSAQGFRPSIVHVNRKGEVSFPAHENAPIRPGYKRVELKTVSEIRKFEKNMNEKLRGEYMDYKARDTARFDAMQRQRRSELRTAISTGRATVRDKDGNLRVVEFSEADRDFARMAIERNDKRQRFNPHYDAGFFMEALSMDASNREAHRDVLTGWQGRK